MQNKRVLMIAGGLLGLAALCCVGIVLFGYVYNEGDENSRVTQGLEGLKTVCDGEALAETAEFNPSAPDAPTAAIVQHVAGNEYIFVSTAWEYQPDSLEETELVICLEDREEVVIETCEYTLEDGAGEATITRIGLEANYRLIAAQTAEVVEQGSVRAVPRECMAQETFEDNADFELRGDFGEALEPLLAQYSEAP